MDCKQLYIGEIGTIENIWEHRATVEVVDRMQS